MTTPKPIFPAELLPQPYLEDFPAWPDFPTGDIPPEDLALILKHARSSIEDGWCQNTYWMKTPDGQRQYCAIGAVRQAVDVFLGYTSGMVEEIPEKDWIEMVNARATLGARASRAVITTRSKYATVSDLARYNDANGRTKEEILALFDKAIERAQEAQS